MGESKQRNRADDSGDLIAKTEISPSRRGVTPPGTLAGCAFPAGFAALRLQELREGAGRDPAIVLSGALGSRLIQPHILPAVLTVIKR